MRILVVEDEHRIASKLKKGLEQEKYVVDVAHDGITGFDLAATEDYSLIVLDIMLPGKDGLSVCRELRAQNIHTPVLLLTARAQTSDKVVGLDSGADDYLTKPFSFEELFARVRALSRRPKNVMTDELKVEDLILDSQSFAVSRAGTPLHLSSKEFKILKYLMSNARKIVSKERIMNQVWDYDADVLPNTVEAYIKNLRKKIDAPFPHLPPLLHTIRGFGYKVGSA